mmetsp:Transcript_74107/g.146836  ORF Transcript_74107/g.146836 Transcript_74107/m.146836 type:complete len:750 (+) Transcript_74107:113-2362(+)
MDSGGPAHRFTTALGLIVHTLCTGRSGRDRRRLAEIAPGSKVEIAGDTSEAAVISTEASVETGAPLSEDGQSAPGRHTGSAIVTATVDAVGSGACEQQQGAGETCNLPPEYEVLLEQRLAAYVATSPLKEVALPLELSADSTMEPLSHRSSSSGLPAWRLPGEDQSTTATQTSNITFGHTLGGISPALLLNSDPLDNADLNDGRISPVRLGDEVFNCPSSMVLSSEESPLTPTELAHLRDQVLEVAAEEGARVSARGRAPQPPTAHLTLPPEAHAELMGLPAQRPAMSQPLTSSPREQPHGFITKEDLFRTPLPVDPMGVATAAAPPPPLQLPALQLPVHSNCPDQPRRAPPSSTTFTGQTRKGRQHNLFVAMGSMNGSLNNIPQDGNVSARWTARSFDSSNAGSLSSRDATQLHGIGSRLQGNGFIGQGPFWTCGSSMSCNASRHPGAAATCTADGPSASTDSRCSQPQKDGVTLASTSATLVASKDAQADVASRISATIAECMELAAQAINITPDSAPPEEELTTVLLETKEQKLHWRDFLAETVSTYKANNLFKSYDVEADPPRYSRPPLSRPQAGFSPKDGKRATLPAGAKGPSPLNVGHMPRRKDPTPPQVVAPRGAGWSPILGGASKRRSRAETTPSSRLAACSFWFRGCVRPGQSPTSTPLRCSEDCAADFEPANPRMWTLGRRRQSVEEAEVGYVGPRGNPLTDEVAQPQTLDDTEGCGWHPDLSETPRRHCMSQKPARAG